MAQWSCHGAELEPAEGARTLADEEDLAIGALIKALRAERGWSAQKLADECERVGMKGLNRSAISKLETGARNLKADEAVQLAQVFGVTTDFLLKGVSFRQKGTVRPEKALEGDQTGHARETRYAGLRALGEVHRAEVDQIMSWLDTGRGTQALLVLGPPGIGK